MTQRLMPSLFLGHGSPLNLILDNSFTQGLKTLSTKMPQPKAILVISAHWCNETTQVSYAAKKNETLYDFYGFPEALYTITYHAPSAGELAEHIATLLDIPLMERGLDHGAWMPLHFLYPKANIPTIQLSINKNLPLALHVKIGKQLQCLREEGVLILGSGNVTHNLGEVDFWHIDAKPPQWAVNVDTFIQKAFESRDIQSLIDIETLCPDFKRAHPSLDHYLPLLYIAGMMRDEDTVVSLFTFFQNASLSMRGFLLR